MKYVYHNIKKILINRGFVTFLLCKYCLIYSSGAVTLREKYWTWVEYLMETLPDKNQTNIKDTVFIVLDTSGVGLRSSRDLASQPRVWDIKGDARLGFQWNLRWILMLLLSIENLLLFHAPHGNRQPAPQNIRLTSKLPQRPMPV